MRSPLALCVVVGGGLCAAGPVNTDAIGACAGVPAGVDHSVVPSIVGGSWIGGWTCSCCSGTVDDADVDVARAAVGDAAVGAGDVG